MPGLAIESGAAVFLKAQARNVVAEWIKRVALDRSLTSNAQLPDCNAVQQMREMVDFLIESVDQPQHYSIDTTVLFARRCARQRFDFGDRPSVLVLECGHLRDAFEEAIGKCNVLLAPDIGDRLSTSIDLLLAQIIEEYVTIQNRTFDARRHAVEDESDKRKLILELVGHELRSPLTPIFTWIDVLLHHANTPNTETIHLIEQACHGVQRSARTLKRLIDDLNDFNALANGKLSINRVTLDVRAVVEDCVEVCGSRATAAKISLTHHLPQNCVMIYADEMRLLQCLMNLLNNAIKFTPEGGRISVSVQHTGTHARIEVSDTGIGIPNEKLPAVFEPFRQLEPGTKAGGLGLGLAIVKSIVGLHAGRATAHSEGPGRGTTIRMDFPVVNS
jgi:signal transduction histidine kinase